MELCAKSMPKVKSTASTPKSTTTKEDSNDSKGTKRINEELWRRGRHHFQCTSKQQHQQKQHEKTETTTPTTITNNNKWKNMSTSKSYKKITFIEPHSGSIMSNVIKQSGESIRHVLIKGILWALFLSRQLPSLQETDDAAANDDKNESGDLFCLDWVLDRDIGDDRFIPDVAALSVPIHNNSNNNNTLSNQQKEPQKSGSSSSSSSSILLPLFWGESGRISHSKIIELARRYPNTYIVHLRWGVHETHITDMIDAIIQQHNNHNDGGCGGFLQKRTKPIHFGILQQDPIYHVTNEGIINIDWDRDIQWWTIPPSSAAPPVVVVAGMP